MKNLMFTLFLVMFTGSLCADSWNPPCEGNRCKIFVTTIAKDQERTQIGPAQIFFNGVGLFEIFLAGQTTGPTLNEPLYDLDLELYHWRQDPDEVHAHFHLIATSALNSTSREHIAYPATAGLYQIRVRKMSGYTGSVVVFLKL